MPTSPMKQTHFQWFNDDGTPAGESARRGEDSNLPAVAPGARFLLRVQSQHMGDHYLSAARRLQYRLVGSNQWWDVSEGMVPPYTAPLFKVSTWFGNGAAITTQRLSTPSNATSGNFVGGQARMTATPTDPMLYGPKAFTEDLFSLCLLPGTPGGLEVELRVTENGRPYERYRSYPRMTAQGYQPSEMDVKANQLSAEAQPLARLEFQRDNAWWNLSDRLLFPFTITKRLKAVATADLSLDNADGRLARDNAVSSWNYDVSSTFDPLLDEGRVIRIRQGVELHPNLAYGLTYACSPAPTRPNTLRGGELTDGGFGQPRNEHDDAWVGWQSAATVTFSLSPARSIRAVAVSLLTKVGADVLLPSSASVTLVGSAGTYTAPLAASHLRDDPSGQRQYLYGLDLNQRDVSRVTFNFYPKPGAWVCADEVALYDASTTADWMKTTFTGILGDDITQQATDRGLIRVGQVRDMTKRLADRFVEVFGQYENLSIEAIIEDLLTNPQYEAGLEAKDYALDATGFTMPKWTEQNASVLDACAQLAKMIGWVFEADDEGVFTFRDLDGMTQTAEETYLADRDLLGWAPSISGINLRNRIVVKSRDARNQDISATVEDAESIARYGPRLFTLFEPVARTAKLARQLANAIRRDYSWVQPTGSGVVVGDAFMRPGRVVTVVESGCTRSGPDRLYRVEAVTHRQTGHRHGEHTMGLELRGYRSRAVSAPESLTATPMLNGVSLGWAEQPEEPAVAGYGVFRANSLGGSYTECATVGGPPAVVASLTNAQTYWFKVAAYTEGGILGEFAGPAPCAPSSGGQPTQAEEAWQPRSLSAQAFTIWGVHRPKLTWMPGMAAPPTTCYNIYRSQVSTGPFALAGTRTQPGSGPAGWVDYGAARMTGRVYYEVTYYDPGSDFESWASEVAWVDL